MRWALATTLAGAAVLAAGCGSGGEPEAAAAPDGTTTATVQRRTLVTRENVDGTLGYAGARPLLQRLGGDGGPDASGPTITWLPREGSHAGRGDALYRADGEPVRLLYGSTPAYRDLAPGTEGADVRQLERNLRALGHDPGAVDGTFDADTAAAVRAWQADAGWTQTGVVRLGQVAFLPGPRRIGDVKVATGDVAPPGTEVMTTTSREQVVHVDLPADDQDLARRAGDVTVTLPGGRTVDGRISRVGRVAEAPAAQQGEPGGDEEPTIDVTVRLAGDADTGRLDGAPVSVGLAAEVGRDVLAVPVTALLALPGGGYAVERRTAAGTERVPVEPGQFADGLVAVRGALRAGDEVVVPDGL